MLEVRGLSSGYDKLIVLRGIDLALEANRVSVLIGRNGVGKTTLLRTIAGHCHVTSGTIVMDGNDVTNLPSFQRARQGIAYVPQGREIFGGLTVRENLMIGVRAMRGRDAARRLSETLELLPVLKDRLHDRGGNLSGGQQQILAIGRALITEPTVLLLDEPSEGIQPSIVSEIAEMIARIAQERSVAVLVAEQNLDFVASVAERVTVMDHGQVVTELPVTRLIEEASLQHEYLGV
jgi:urea ABC transporter ATP-binding protein UrtE